MGSRPDTDGAPRRAGRAGAASGRILGLVALSALAAVVLMWRSVDGPPVDRPSSGSPSAAGPAASSSPSAPPVASTPAPAAAGTERPSVPRAAGPPPRARSDADGSANAARPAPAPAPAPAADGRGSIRGRVFGPGGGPPPAGTEVTLEPSAHLLGSRRGVRRTSAVDPEGRYRFEDLPLAGYELRARYPEGASEKRHVLLRSGGAELALDLQLRPRAVIVGRVHGPDGLVVDAIDVQLQRVGPDGRASLAADVSSYAGRTRTDLGGWFRFDDVEDGAYRVLVGPPGAPAIDPLEVRVAGRAVELPRIEVPRLGRIELLVTDALGHPLADVEVDGFGSAGGLVRGASDAFGRLSATLLPPGDYRLRANDPTHGVGYVSVGVPPDAGPVEATMVLRR